MKKRIAAAMLAALLVLSSVCAAFAAGGKSTETATLYVHADQSGASITLKSSKGRASIDMYSTGGNYIGTKEDQVHGFYFVRITGPGMSQVINWAPSASVVMRIRGGYESSSALTLRFPQAGDYTVTVEPMTSSDISNYWLSDRFARWLSAASWSVTKENGCRVSGAPPDTKRATVSVEYIDEKGNVLYSYEDSLTPSVTAVSAPPSYTDPYTQITYSLTSSNIQSVTVSNGTAYPSRFKFYYQRSTPLGTADVCVYYLLEDQSILDRVYYTLSEGTHTVSAPSYYGDYYRISGSSQSVTVYRNGTCSPGQISFYYRRNATVPPTQPPVTRPPVTQPPVSNTPYDIGIPNLYGRVYTSGEMNVTILWVQVQMKATGVYYQGDVWDETGNLGDHTMKEIAKFMKSRGYGSHSGNVDQRVIDELASYLGSRRVPVYVGGYYEHMNSIMYGGSAGSMDTIVSNNRDGVDRSTLGARWVQACLSKLGYYSSAIDGKYGSVTEKAVKRFQRDYGFQERDYVSLGVARAMLEACYRAGCYLDDLP